MLLGVNVLGELQRMKAIENRTSIKNALQGLEQV